MWEAAAATSAKKAVATLATTLEMPVRIVDVENPALGSSAANHSRLGTYAKLNVWRLNSLYVVYIDVDTLAVRNPAEAFLALADERVQIAYCGSREIFNSGVMALRPREHVYNQITRLLRHGGHFTKGNPTEQDLIVQYFSTLSRTRPVARSISRSTCVRGCGMLPQCLSMLLLCTAPAKASRGLKYFTLVVGHTTNRQSTVCPSGQPGSGARLCRTFSWPRARSTAPTTPPARCSAGRSLRVRNAFRGSPKHGLGSSACRHWQALTLLLFRNTVHFASCVSQATEVNFTTLADPC